MTAFANLVLADSAAANQTFTPAAIDSSGVAKWLDNNAVFNAKRAVTMSVSYPSASGSVVRVKQKVSIPVMDTVDTTKQVGECIASLELVLPKVATLTQRKDLKAFAANLLTNAVSTAAVESFESIY